MNEKKETNWVLRIFTGFVFLVSNLIAGAALGLLYVRLFVDIDMGFGGVADALGGVMIGALLAFVVSVVMLFVLSVRLQWIWIGIAVVIAGLTIAGLAITAQAAQPITKEFQPPYIIKAQSIP